MTGMTGRCRRNHQKSCEGTTTKGLCTKHRAEWEAMKADWAARDAAAQPAVPRTPKTKDRPWTAAEQDIIRTHTIAEAVALLGRTPRSVEKQRWRLGITSRTKWTPEKDQVLRDHDSDTAARLLGLKLSVVKSRRSNAAIPAPRKTTP